jgi:hypothetical protein
MLLIIRRYLMPDYEKLYHKAFNAITDAERMLETASAMLRIAQQECEELYIAPNDDNRPQK